MTKNRVLKGMAAGMLAAAGLALASAGGCATAATPEDRIDRTRGYFESLPLAAQARIRGGQTDLGFTQEMTRLALGEPERKMVRRTAEGTTEVWLYMDTERRYERGQIDFVGVPDGRGGRLTGGGNVSLLLNRDIVATRVEFREGVVTAVETTLGEAP